MTHIDTVEALKRAFYQMAPPWAFRASLQVLHAISGARAMGLPQYRRFRAMRRATSTVQVLSADIASLPYAIWYRPGTSDVDMIMENVVRKQYLYFTPPEPISLIVDAGANIGDSTALYLFSFPRAAVVALEPDHSNFEILQRNCAAYGDRAVLLNKGLWDKEAHLKVSQSYSHCTISVSEVDPTAPYDCPATTIPAILQLTGKGLIDILKVDIEGAEAVVFGDSSDAWLDRVRRIFIEVHNSASARIVLERAKRHSFAVRCFRSLYILYRE
jgi:FkbM family methyltransferase